MKYSVSAPFLMFVAGVALAGELQPFTALGAYSNFRFTQEHQYGAQVELWKDGSSLVGRFYYSEGLIGDVPVGLLEKIEFDPVTGKIAFSAKLTRGEHSCRIHKNVPGRDLYNFEGVLTATSISGILKHADGLHPEQAPTEEKTVLQKLDAASIIQYQSREEWESATKTILRYRGPKW